jgi:hypothetical protein
MGDSPVDQATHSFRQTLADASSGEQARVDALVVLADRLVFVATWPGPNQAARTLTNSHGESALPLFTGLDVLEATATRFGWRNPDGSLQFRELGALEALRHALARSVHFVVIDMGCEHSVEFAREEIEPLLQSSPEPTGTGPFAGSSEHQAAILDAVRRNSNRPPRPPLVATPTHSQTRALVDHAAGGRPLPQPPQALLLSSPPMAARSRTPLPTQRALLPEPSTVNRLAPGQAPTQPRARPASIELADVRPPEPPRPPGRDDEPTLAERTGTQGALAHARSALSDTALQALCGELRSFPEVEWACVLSDGSEIPLIAVRVDPSFLNRVADITDVIMDVGEQQSLNLQVLLLNNQDLVKQARKHGHAFYPWRR